MRTALLLLLLALPALAQDPRPDPPKPSAPASEAAAPKKAEEEPKKKKEPDRFLAVTGGDVFTVTGPVLRGATVLAKNGKVVAVGERVTVPAGAETLDARGLRVYPGLVAFDTSGLLGPIPADSTDVFSLNMLVALSGGLTTVASGPTVAKLTWGTLEDHVVATEAYTRLDVGSGQALANLRAELERLRAYGRERKAYEQARARGEDAKEPDRAWIKGRAAQLEALMQGRGRAVVNASTRAQLVTVATLAVEYGLRLVIVGAEEAWTVAPLLGRAQSLVVLSPHGRADPDPRLLRDSGWSIEAALRLHEAGVPVAVLPEGRGISLGGVGGRDLNTLHLEAAFAARGGLPEAAALEAITIVPARALGVDDRVGSIEVGKDCDLLITDREVLHYEMLARWTVVNGRVAYDKLKEPFVRHVRAKDGEQNEVVPQLWPRRPGEPEPAMPERELR